MDTVVFAVYLAVFVLIVTFLIFYSSNVVASVINYVVNLYLWRTHQAYFEVTSVKLSILGGRILFRRLRYVTKSYALRIEGGYITFRYWLFDPRDYQDISMTASVRSRFAIYAEGAEYFIYNHSTAYERLRAVLAKRKAEATGQQLAEELQRLLDPYANPPAADSASTTAGNESVPMMLPMDIFVDRGAIVIGNSSTVSLLVGSFRHCTGLYTAYKSRNELDKLRYVLRMSIEQAEISLTTNYDNGSTGDDVGPIMNRNVIETGIDAITLGPLWSLLNRAFTPGATVFEGSAAGASSADAGSTRDSSVDIGRARVLQPGKSFLNFLSRGSTNKPESTFFSPVAPPTAARDKVPSSTDAASDQQQQQQQQLPHFDDLVATSANVRLFRNRNRNRSRISSTNQQLPQQGQPLTAAEKRRQELISLVGARVAETWHDLPLYATERLVSGMKESNSLLGKPVSKDGKGTTRTSASKASAASAHATASVDPQVLGDDVAGNGEYARVTTVFSASLLRLTYFVDDPGVWPSVASNAARAQLSPERPLNATTAAAGTTIESDGSDDGGHSRDSAQIERTASASIKSTIKPSRSSRKTVSKQNSVDQSIPMQERRNSRNKSLNRTESAASGSNQPAPAAAAAAAAAAQLDPLCVPASAIAAPAPVWRLDLIMHNTTVNYGPWADRQRVELMNLYYPFDYEDLPARETPKAGHLRVAEAFQLLVRFEGDSVFRIPFREQSKDSQFGGSKPNPKWLSRRFAWLDWRFKSGSTIHYRMPYVYDDNGGDSQLRVELQKCAVVTSLNYGDMANTASVRLAATMRYPSRWNEPKMWCYDLAFGNPKVILKNEKFIKNLFIS